MCLFYAHQFHSRFNCVIVSFGLKNITHSNYDHHTICSITFTLFIWWHCELLHMILTIRVTIMLNVKLKWKGTRWRSLLKVVRLLMCCRKDPPPFLTWYLPTTWSNLVEILWASAPFHVLLLPQVPKRFNKGLIICKPPKLRSKGYHTNLMFHFTSIQQLHEKYFLMWDVHSFPSFPFPLHNYSHVFLVMFYLFSYTRASQILMEKTKWMNPRISNPFNEPSSLPRVNLLLWPMGMKGNHFLALSSN